MKKLILFVVIASFIFISSGAFALKSEIQVNDVEKVFIQCSSTVCKVDVKTRFRGPVTYLPSSPSKIPVKITPQYMERRVITPNLIVPSPVLNVNPIPIPPVYNNTQMLRPFTYWQGCPSCQGLLRGIALLPANLVNAILQIPREILY